MWKENGESESLISSTFGQHGEIVGLKGKRIVKGRCFIGTPVKVTKGSTVSIEVNGPSEKHYTGRNNICME